MIDLSALIAFRHATPQDLPVIVAMLADDVLSEAREDPSLPLDPGYAAAFAAIAANPNQYLMVAEHNGEVIATLQITFQPGLSKRGAWDDMALLIDDEMLDTFAVVGPLDTIAGNRIFAVVADDIAPRRAVALGETFEPLPGLKVELFATPGKVPLWLEEGVVSTDIEGEHTVGAAVEVAGRKLLYIPGCSRVTEALHARIGTCHALFFDGTLYEDNEMIRTGLGEKTGRRMGHLPVSGGGGSLESLARHAGVRRIYIHINNTNPMLIEGSFEAQAVAAAGWEIGQDGMAVSP